MKIMALTPAARRAIAIRNNIKRKAEAKPAVEKTASNDNGMHPRLLAMCVESAGFDQNAAYA